MQQTDEQKSGFILINKPKGITSHDVVDELRKITGIRKIGHAGTLDPAATGLLILGIGRATKQMQELIGLDKEYEAIIELGKVSDTYDSEGKVEKCQMSNDQCPMNGLESVLTGFVGEQDQIPPMYSARKVGGKKLYELARQGKIIERPAKKITIHKIEMQSYEWPILKIIVECSSGTYIRSLAHDIGQTLGCGAYLKELIRTSIGKNKLSSALELADLDENNWQEYLLEIGLVLE